MARTRLSHARMSLRRLLLLLVAIVLVPLIVTQAAVYALWYRAQRADELRDDAATARAVAMTLDEKIADIAHQELAVGDAADALWPAEREKVSRLLANTAREYALVSYFHWVSPEGAILASSDARAVGIEIGDRDYFKEALSAQGWAVSDVITSRLTGVSVFVLARAVRDDAGTVRGAVVASVECPRLADAFPTDSIDEGSAVFVFDSAGALVVASPPTAVPGTDKGAEARMLARALAGEEDVGAFYDDRTREARLGAYVPMRPMGWVAAVSRPRGAALAPLAASLPWIVALLAAGVAISVLSGFGVTSWIVKSVRRVQRHAEALGRGEDDPGEPASVRELADLSAAFERAAADIIEAREKAQEGQAILDTLMEHIPAGIVIADAPGMRIRAASRYGVDLVRAADESEVRPADWPEQLRKYNADGTPMAEDELPLTRAIRRGEVTTNLELYIRRPGMEGMVPVLVSAAPIHDSGGRIIGGVLVWRDIADIKEAMDRLETTAAELERSNRDLEQFAYVASHDLQEPLRMITGYLQLIERRYKGSLDEDADEFINFAVDGAARMQRLITDLLTYSRVGARGSPFGPVDMEEVLEHAMENLEGAIEESGAVVTHDALPTVHGDKTQLTQLLQNLIGNALKFRGEAAPAVHVAAEPYDRRWRFSVRDNGIGIESQYERRIFLIFQRLHGRREYPGTGIGLAICKKIVDRHGGRIWVESEPGRGSTFFFTLEAQGET